MQELRPDRSPCPFVVEGEATKRIALSHYSAGRDATYVLVSRKSDSKMPMEELAVAIGYAPFVEGTAIIYDLTDETMQGKARPFVCHLSRRMARSYMLLPFQVEAIAVRMLGRDKKAEIQVA